MDKKDEDSDCSLPRFRPLLPKPWFVFPAKYDYLLLICHAHTDNQYIDALRIGQVDFDQLDLAGLVRTGETDEPHDDSMSVGDLSDMESEWDPCETSGLGWAVARATSNNGRTTPLNG